MALNAKTITNKEYFYGHKACGGCSAALAIRLALKVLGESYNTADPAVLEQAKAKLSERGFACKVEGDGETVLELRVAPEDMGKVIGRQGRIAKEIRILMRSVAQRSGKRVSVEIVD